MWKLTTHKPVLGWIGKGTISSAIHRNQSLTYSLHYLSGSACAWVEIWPYASCLTGSG